jgi:hypothetical protein
MEMRGTPVHELVQMSTGAFVEDTGVATSVRSVRIAVIHHGPGVGRRMRGSAQVYFVPIILAGGNRRVFCWPLPMTLAWEMMLDDTLERLKELPESHRGNEAVSPLPPFEDALVVLPLA